jgi:hypothetical protein
MNTYQTPNAFLLDGVRDYLATHGQEPPTADQLAAHMHLSATAVAALAGHCLGLVRRVRRHDVSPTISTRVMVYLPADDVESYPPSQWNNDYHRPSAACRARLAEMRSDN